MLIELNNHRCNKLGQALFFVRSGRIYLLGSAGTFQGAGLFGLYNSSRVSSSGENLYFLNINTAIDASYYHVAEGMFRGRSLRCLSTVLDI